VKIRVPIAGTIGKSVQFDPEAGARAEAAVAALAAQISAGLGGTILHRNLRELQVGDDHPQYAGNAFPETITGQWNFSTIPYIQGDTLAEYIEDVVGGSFFDFLQDTTSVVWTYHETANELEANVPPEFVQDTVGAMLTDTTSIDLAYNDSLGTFTASIIDEYVQDLVGAMLVDTTTVDFTYNDALGQISAVVPGAALTKTDDTNVTLTLGGSASTALARAASLTLGWTGTLAVARGGSGAATLTGYLKGNGTSAFTASATVPGSDIDGAALTKVDDTNVTLTLGGTPATSLLRAASLTLGWTGQLAETRGGTNQSTYAQGDILYASAANTLSKLAKNTTATRYLSNTGTSNNPAWAQIDLTNGVTGVLPAANLPGSFNGFANPSASVGLTAVNGSAATAMRSDGAPALDVTVNVPWTGTHTWIKSVAGAYNAATFQNSSNSSSAYMAFKVLNDASRGMNYFRTSSTFGGAISSGMPSGEASLLASDGNFPLGFETNNLARMVITGDGGVGLRDGITAPATLTGWALLYVDSADGDLKIKFGDGTVKTIVVDT